MAPTFHFVRHAQGFHNLGAEFYSLQDPPLTPLGLEQCEALRQAHFPDQSQISLITASPLSRTLNTAFTTFKPALSNGKCNPKIFAIPDAQETSDYPCDTGSDPDVLTRNCLSQNIPADLSLVKPGWNVKTMDSRYSPDNSAIERRAHAVRLTLREKARDLVASGDENPHIVLVAHGAVLHYITGDWERADLFQGTGWANCETRSYNFTDGVGPEASVDALLTETQASRKSRGLDYPMPDVEQQRKLFKTAMQGWEDQGLQRPDMLNLVVEDGVLMGKDEMGPLQRQRSRSMSVDIAKGRRPSLVKVAA
jgi:broad specificity phosphatase PhoE